MPVQFKFRGERSFRSLLNVTTPCTLQRVKTALFEQSRINDQTTDLTLEDGVTGGVFDPNALLVPDALVQVIVRRTPIHASIPAALPDLAPDDTPTLASTGIVALVGARQEEDSAIDQMVEQHDLFGMGQSSSSTGGVLRYSRSYRLAVSDQQKKREGYDGASSGEDDVFEDPKEPPPPNYTCHRCGMTGGKPESHWIWECPTNDDPDHMKKVRTARGVPREFLRKVESVEAAADVSAGGVVFTLPGHSGHYVYAHEATYEDRKLRVGDTVREKVVSAFTDGAKKVEDSLKCPLCNQIFRQAILAPCCGATFCSDCVVDRLASASVDNSRCPGCRKEVYAHQLIANEDIRKQVEEITRASKATAVAKEKEKQEKERPKVFELTAALKDRVNRPKKFAAAAIEDAPVSALRGDTAGVSETKSSVALAPVSAATKASAEPLQMQREAAAAPLWQPLGFGPMLSAEQFVEWQRAVSAGPRSARTRELFEDWQRQTREAMPAPLPAPPSKESFEEWKRTLQGPPPGAAQPRPAEVAGTTLVAPASLERRKSKKEKKEKKERRSRPETAEDAAAEHAKRARTEFGHHLVHRSARADGG
mmetsp:Transcript_44100/g.81068  ORF Transcript_44100/g.81068 Transcript_44100/m.81068 type:complete len:593 (+) Transcript_44100:77-1855(+)